MQLALFGNRLVGVIPGRVLSSNATLSRESFFIRKSTLAKSLHEQASYAF